MQLLKHVSYTWLLAHAIHPIIWLISGWLYGEYAELSSVKSAVGLSILALVVSIPVIPFYYIINRGIIRSSFLPLEKFIIWLLCAPLITACTAFALMVFLSNFEYVLAYIDELILFAIPSIIATVLSVCARYDYFIEYNSKYHSTEEPS